MIRFVLSASMVYGVLAAWAVIAGWEFLGREHGQAVSVVLMAFAGPTLATWLAAEGLGVITPRRVLHRRLSMPILRTTLGFVAGVIGCVLGVLAMALFDREIEHDVLFTAGAAAVSAVLVLIPTARVRRGVCLLCGYSTAGATPAARGVCVECGADVYAA